MSHSDEDTVSDDEIFFGKLSLKELKKHLTMEQSYANSGGSKTWMSVSLDEVKQEADCNTSIHIIETHSQPNLRPVETSPKFSSVPGTPVHENRKSDDSFIQMENMVSKFCLTKEKDLELNNTLEVIEYILNNGPDQNTSKTNTEKNVKSEKICSQSPLQINSKHDSSSKPMSPMEIAKEKTSIKDSPKYFTPPKSAQKFQVDVFDTPSSVLTPTFKTPANPKSKKYPSASLLKITPCKTKAYQHITSPVACYIKNCPQVPLVQDVHPKKPLPGTSSIPKLVKMPLHGRIQNKENMSLPSIAYKSAKKTKVINQPSEKKLPQSQWVKKITCSQPTIMRHANREISEKPLMEQQEDSFANLSCLQAEVSICTQKTAYKNN